jgi:hypothetical protein
MSPWARKNKRPLPAPWIHRSAFAAAQHDQARRQPTAPRRDAQHSGHLTIERKDVDRPLQVTVMREVIYGPTVKLQVRLQPTNS